MAARRRFAIANLALALADEKRAPPFPRLLAKQYEILHLLRSATAGPDESGPRSGSPIAAPVFIWTHGESEGDRELPALAVIPLADIPVQSPPTPSLAHENPARPLRPDRRRRRIRFTRSPWPPRLSRPADSDRCVSIRMWARAPPPPPPKGQGRFSVPRPPAPRPPPPSRGVLAQN